MQVVRSICGTVCLFLVYVCFRVAWKHVQHPDGPIATKLGTDLFLAGILAFCAYSLFTWEKRHASRSNPGGP